MDRLYIIADPGHDMRRQSCTNHTTPERVVDKEVGGGWEKLDNARPHTSVAPCCKGCLACTDLEWCVVSAILHYISPWGVVYPMADGDLNNHAYVRPTSLASEAGELSPKTKQLLSIACQRSWLPDGYYVISLYSEKGCLT